MNIGLFADCYPPTASGVVTSLLQLKRGLERRGHNVLVFAVSTPGQPRLADTDHCFPSLPFNRASGFRFGLVNPRTVRRMVREAALDIIHTHTEYSLGWTGRLAARSLGLPLVHTVHTMHEAYRHYLFFGRLVSARAIKNYLRLFLSEYDAVICPSAKAETYLADSVPGLRTVIIANGVDPAPFRGACLIPAQKDRSREALGIRPSDEVMLFVGRMGKEKRVLELLGLLAPLLRGYPQRAVLFVGSGPLLKEMVLSVEHAGIAQQVVFTGGVRWDQLPGLYAAADVFVTASLSEVHPMTLIEASMCGLPLVARRDDSFAGMIRDGYNGYLADSDREMTQRLAELLGDGQKLREFAVNSLALSDGFHVDCHVDTFEALYQSLTKAVSGDA
jgi:1,2-diacylglycerol 3-alpha-glucosyltransferase